MSDALTVEGDDDRSLEAATVIGSVLTTVDGTGADITWSITIPPKEASLSESLIRRLHFLVIVKVGRVSTSGATTTEDDGAEEGPTFLF